VIWKFKRTHFKKTNINFRESQAAATVVSQIEMRTSSIPKKHAQRKIRKEKKRLIETRI